MTATLPRLSLRCPASPFTSAADRTARVSFLEVEDVEPVVRGLADDLAQVSVIVWPTDARGYVDADAVKAGRARVTTWRLTDGDAGALRRLLLAGWTFDDRDFLVTGGPRGRVVPCPETLRASPWAPTVTDADLRRLAGG